MNILLIEDEPEVAHFIKTGLEEQEHIVTVVHDGKIGQTTAVEKDFDLLILDIILPHSNGLQICKHVRTQKKDIPILMLTALSTVSDKVLGLENGADDYLTKPFHFDELLARIKALTRRQIANSGKIYTVADLELNSTNKVVSRNGKEISLTAKEFILLEVLMANTNKVLSRKYIAEQVWGINFDRGTNHIDVYINYLRSKIDKNHSKKLIHTVIGMGYVLKEQA
ncbi:MAG TPA: response regulator transcription factor [Bacteroidia bacterium]|jgi:two-component system copper resistance phosphate regulon response regulator CusR|nr:response regulator transcription factor [Bacteroidia bacterium]